MHSKECRRAGPVAFQTGAQLKTRMRFVSDRAVHGASLQMYTGMCSRNRYKALIDSSPRSLEAQLHAKAATAFLIALECVFVMHIKVLCSPMRQSEFLSIIEQALFRRLCRPFSQQRSYRRFTLCPQIPLGGARCAKSGREKLFSFDKTLNRGERLNFCGSEKLLLLGGSGWPRFHVHAEIYVPRGSRLLRDPV